jgi:hypothetical protein
VNIKQPLENNFKTKHITGIYILLGVDRSEGKFSVAGCGRTVAKLPGFNFME